MQSSEACPRDLSRALLVLEVTGLSDPQRLQLGQLAGEHGQRVDSHLSAAKIEAVEQRIACRSESSGDSMVRDSPPPFRADVRASQSWKAAATEHEAVW